MKKNTTDPNYKIIAENRRARYDYSIEEEIECGLSLVGSEVKSLRQKSANIGAVSYTHLTLPTILLV